MDNFIDQYIQLTKEKQQRQENITGLTFWDPKHRLQGLINEVKEVEDELKRNN